MITICGRRGDGPVVCRRVSMITAQRAWGRFFRAVMSAREWSRLVVDDMEVWTAR